MRVCSVQLVVVFHLKLDTLRADVFVNRRSVLHCEDHHRSAHLLSPVPAFGRRRICPVQEEVRNRHSLFSPRSVVIWASVFTKRAVCSFSQTQGPSGPIYASSNPEYLSTNDGKRKF